MNTHSMTLGRSKPALARQQWCLHVILDLVDAKETFAGQAFCSSTGALAPHARSAIPPAAASFHPWLLAGMQGARSSMVPPSSPCGLCMQM